MGARTFWYPRIHEVPLVQLPPSMLNRLFGAELADDLMCRQGPGGSEAHRMLACAEEAGMPLDGLADRPPHDGICSSSIA